MALKTKIRKLYVAEEVTFSTDPSSSGASYLYVKADSDLLSMAADMVESGVQNDRLVGAAPVPARAKLGITFRVPLRASGTPSAPPSTPAIAPEADLILKNAIGTVTRGQSTTAATGGTTTSIAVTASAGFVVGGLVYVVNGALPTDKLRFVSAIPDGTHITVDTPLSAPVTTGNIIAANYYTPADSGMKSLAIVAVVDSALYTLLGCRPTGLKINGLGVIERPMVEVTYEADTYTTSAKGSLPAADDRFPSVVSQVMKGAPCFVGGALTQVAGFDFDFGLKSEWLESTEAANGRQGWEMTDRAPKGSFQALWANTYLTDLLAGSAKGVGIAVGPQTSGWGIWAPSCNYIQHANEDRNGLLMSKVEFGVYDPPTTQAELVLSVF